ncbi:MAG: thioredoxin fold domain-containing protein [Polyangiaceae bacterium]|nr:thioredoxin fold domain-containing protein [Polyangiaceae bacterium]
MGRAARIWLLPFLSALAFACAPSVPGSAEPPVQAPPDRPVTFLEGDFAAALTRASTEKKLVFVDAWAPWCHTCLSMRDVVLSRPELARFERSYVFVALDTDREESAEFLERYRMRVWPTFFVLSPESGTVLAMHGGAMSLEEMTTLLEAGLATQKAGPSGAPGQLALAQAHQAYVSKDMARAASLYEEAAGLLGDDRRAEALLGAMRALSESGDPAKCATYGREHAAGVPGSAAPVDFLYYLQSCAEKLPEGEDRAAAVAVVKARILALVESPPAGSSTDDKADALAVAAEVMRDAKDDAGAKRFEERRLALLEQAAKEAKTPEMAQVHDYERLMTLIALGRANDAVTLLAERTKQLPNSYEAHARHAQALIAAGRLKDAVAAIDRAIQLSYGPRRLGYLARKADTLGKLGEKEAQIATLELEVRGWTEQGAGHADEGKLADAEKRLAAAREARP